jgi:hypothetical protein
MDSVALLDRVDTKFIFKADMLPGFLKMILPHYYVLDIKKNRMSGYETIYYDTADMDFYKHHHNGKMNRYKIRERCYTDSNLCFFEIKYKNNKERTIKKRMKIGEINERLTDEVKEFLVDKTGLDPESFCANLIVKYSRITLVSKLSKERVTIDTGLSYKRNGESFSYPHIVIAEVKQGKNQFSPFIKVMKANHIRPSGLSKYCLGIVTLNKEVKINNFKSKILYLKKISNEKN